MGKATSQTASTNNATADDKTGNGQHTATGSTSAEIDQQRFELLRSALYHDMRESGLMRLHKTLLFVAILLGSAAIAAFGAAWPIIGQAAGVAVATISAAQLVWDYGTAARDHADLRRRFYDLLAGVEAGADLREVTATMTKIYADEPPVVERINRRAHNRAGTAIYGDDYTRA